MSGIKDIPNFCKMKIIVTWWAGFIGSHIVDALIAKWHEVLVIDNLITGQEMNLQQHISSPLFHFENVDICDKEKVEWIFSTFLPQAVFHLAAQVNIRQSMIDPAYCMKVNTLWSINILESMAKSWCKRIIFSSTWGAMFDNGIPPYDESCETNPSSPYGISKRCGELLLHFYQKQHQIDHTILRYSNVYGPRQDAQGEAGVVSIFADKIEKNIPPTIFGDGTQTRDFIHVSDVVWANIHVFENDIFGLYHVGTGIETSVNDLWKIMTKWGNCSLVPIYQESLGEIQRTSLNPSKLLATGWRIERKIGDLQIKYI